MGQSKISERPLLAVRSRLTENISIHGLGVSFRPKADIGSYDLFKGRFSVSTILVAANFQEFTLLPLI